MLRAVGDWNRARAVPIGLYAEMSVDAVRDPELLGLCRHANITEMFLGIETPRKAGLRETLKMQNVATDLVRTVKTIQSYGMVTVGGHDRRLRHATTATSSRSSTRSCKKPAFRS